MDATAPLSPPTADAAPPVRRGRGRPRSESPLHELHLLLPERYEPYLAEGARLHGTMTAGVLAALVLAYPLDHSEQVLGMVDAAIPESGAK